MPQIQKHSRNVREMMRMFERSVLPRFAIIGKDVKLSFEEVAGVGPRITGPDASRKLMLDVMNAVQFMELDKQMGASDGPHIVIRTYDLYKMIGGRIDELLRMDLTCAGGEATVRLLLVKCSEEFRRLRRAVWLLNVTARAIIWLEKKVARHRPARRWPIRPGI